MTDRELLELAGSALAREVAFDRSTDRFLVEDEFGVVSVPWNPLTDDGDALRLAVKLRLLIGSTDRNEAWVQFYLNGNRPAGYTTVKESHGDDPYAATRRAIVRAAAEIGRGIA